MDRDEARRQLAVAVEVLRAKTRDELLEMLGKPQVSEVKAASGTVYQLEMEVFWEDERGGDLRVIVSVDDGGWSAFAPMSDDFIMAPDGSFVDG